MKKILMIVPYFGKLPSYFNEWLFTASFLGNEGYNFLLLTDSEIDFEIPDNFTFVKTTFDEIKQRIQKIYDFNICLEAPYKLCDFRPAYGEIFSDEISNYDFWGHCDIDLIWGDISKFITEDILNKYEKIQYMGHYSLYKNNEKMNSLYKKNGAHFSYKYVFSHRQFFSFDEHPGIMNIAIKENIKVYISTNQIDFNPKYKFLFCSRINNYSNQIFIWIDGALYRYYINKNKEITYDEYSYAHFQQKKIKNNLYLDKKNIAFLLTKDEFILINNNIINEDLIKKFSYSYSFFDLIYSKIKYNFKKIFNFITMNIQNKKVYLRIRKYTKKVNKFYRNQIHI